MQLSGVFHHFRMKFGKDLVCGLCLSSDRRLYIVRDGLYLRALLPSNRGCRVI